MDDAIEVTLQLHPYLAKYRPRVAATAGPQPVEVAPGTTAGELLTTVCGLPASLRLFIALNGRHVGPTERLHDGDRVRIFMQMSGG